jgi:hypothetical protein
MVNTIELVAEGQGPEGSLVVIVKVTEPAKLSAADGVYTGFNIEELLKVPVPLVVQAYEVAGPVLVAPAIE